MHHALRPRAQQRLSSRERPPPRRRRATQAHLQASFRRLLLQKRQLPRRREARCRISSLDPSITTSSAARLPHLPRRARSDQLVDPRVAVAAMPPKSLTRSDLRRRLEIPPQVLVAHPPLAERQLPEPRAERRAGKVQQAPPRHPRLPASHLANSLDRDHPAFPLTAFPWLACLPAFRPARWRHRRSTSRRCRCRRWRRTARAHPGRTASQDRRACLACLRSLV